jgi:hypothetical protein
VDCVISRTLSTPATGRTTEDFQKVGSLYFAAF